MPSYYVDKTAWPDGPWSAPTRSKILRHVYNRGSTPSIPVRFVDAGVVQELGNTSTVGFGLKANRQSASWLTVPVTATKTGTATATVYTLTPSIMGSDLDTLLGSNDSAAVIAELYFTDSGTGGTAGSFGSGSVQFSARVYKNLNVGGETIPIAPVAFLEINTSASGAHAGVSAAGGSAVVALTASAGAGAYTYVVPLITTGVPAGAFANFRLAMPASSNPTVEIRNATSGGTLLHTITGETGAARWQNVEFRFNGTAWEKFASGDIV